MNIPVKNLFVRCQRRLLPVAEGQVIMRQPPTILVSTPDAHVRAAWQSQLAAAIKTPGLLRELVRCRHEILPRFAAQYQTLRTLPKRVRRMLQRQWAASLASVALMLILGRGAGQAAIINVDGQCSLGEALLNANTDTQLRRDCAAGNGADTIVLPAGSLHTLTTTSLPQVTTTITIEGNGSTIQRAPNSPVFNLINVNETGDLTIQDTTLRACP
jgi:hypothetical protein